MKFKLDTDRSEVQFVVGHLAASTVKGKFTKYSSTLETAADGLSDAVFSVWIDTGSINTNSAQRDKHLRSADFFNCTKYPQMTFEGVYIPAGNTTTRAQVGGALTIKNITRNTVLTVESEMQVTDNQNMPMYVMNLTGNVNRKDFGLRWNAISELGGLVISDRITINIHAEYVVANEHATDTEDIVDE
ncbi:MAG: YceI family protein [Flavipsychrobacter sp.]|nr:YceI family protein [Flavipsychrobacter sp.]